MKSEILGKRFKAEMDRRGLNLYEASALCGVNIPQVSNCMCGGPVPFPRLFRLICSAFNLSADYLLGLSDENKDVCGDLKYQTEQERHKQFKERIHKAVPYLGKFTEIAEKYGFTRGCITKPYAVGIYPRIDICYAVAKETGVSLDWLLGLSDKGGLEE